MKSKGTNEQFKAQLELCRQVFLAKLHDYGVAWRIMRVSSVTDQLLIKASRIRTLEVKGHSMVGEGILPEYIAIVNYSIIGLIQLQLGFSDQEDITIEQAIALYDAYAEAALTLMQKKNHDYDEIWRVMRRSSYVDLILMKIQRTKQIEDLAGQTLMSEGIDANYMDMLNYAVFGLIKLEEEGHVA